MKNPGDKNSLAHYILNCRESHTALKMRESDPELPITYNGIGLFFCPAAGAEGLFATGRMNLATGEVNPLTYNYFATLEYAEFNYRVERS